MSEPALKEVFAAAYKEGGAHALTPHVNFWMGIIDATSETDAGVWTRTFLMDMFVNSMPEQVRVVIEGDWRARRH